MITVGKNLMQTMEIKDICAMFVNYYFQSNKTNKMYTYHFKN